MIKKLKILSLIGVFIFAGICAYSLTMERWRVKKAKRIALRILSGLMYLNPKFSGNTVTINLNEKEIGHLKIKKGLVKLENTNQELASRIANRNIGFNKLAKKVTIYANATITEQSLQKFIDYKLNKIKFRYKVISQAKIKLLNEAFEAKGKIVLKKIPLTVFKIVPLRQAPFKVKCKFYIQKNKLMLDIISGTINHQTITPDLKANLLRWLNPLWDNNKLDVPAKFKRLKFATDQISFAISLFEKDKDK